MQDQRFSVEQRIMYYRDLVKKLAQRARDTDNVHEIAYWSFRLSKAARRLQSLVLVFEAEKEREKKES